MSKETKTVDEKIEPVSEAEVAAPSTVYETVLASMTPAKLASLGVKLISVNNSDLFWVTTRGQLYAFSNYEAALNAEYAWLLSKPE